MSKLSNQQFHIIHSNTFSSKSPVYRRPVQWAVGLAVLFMERKKVREKNSSSYMVQKIKCLNRMNGILFGKVLAVKLALGVKIRFQNGLFHLW